MIPIGENFGRSDRREKLPRLVLLAVWFGLGIGLCEVAVRAVQVFFLHQFIWLSPHVVWMAPLADVCMLVAAGCVLLLARRLWPQLGSFGSVVGVFTFLGLVGPILFIERLHWLASLILAAGIAVQAARFIACWPETFELWVRRTTVPLGAVVVVLALLVAGWRVFETRRALADLPPASPGVPNVVLIVLDTVRAQSLSLYGYARRTTPQLERLAGTGVLFERALSTSSWTLPAHASMFTGRFPHELSADWLTPLDRTYPTLAEVFSAHGYITAGFVGNLLYCNYETGLARGFIHYDDYPISLEMIVRSSWLARLVVENLQSIAGNDSGFARKTGDEINREFFAWLEQKNRQPFFAFLNYMDAHAPYLPPRPFDVMFGPKRPRPDAAEPRAWSAAEIQVERDAYDGAVAFLDHQVGVLVGELEKRGLLRNTVVVITSDHGEELGEHRFFGHGTSLYRTVLQVPLLVFFPSRVPAGKRVDEPVTLRDIPATIIDLAKLGGGTRFPGNSLARYWTGASDRGGQATPLIAEVREGINVPVWYPNTKGNMKSLVADGAHYIKNGDGGEEIYDFENDPWEKKDLAKSEKQGQLRERLRNALDEIQR